MAVTSVISNWWKCGICVLACILAASLIPAIRFFGDGAPPNFAPEVELRFSLSNLGITMGSEVWQPIERKDGTEPSSIPPVTLEALYGGEKVKRMAIGYRILSNTFGKAEIWWTKDAAPIEQWCLNAENSYEGNITLLVDIDGVSDIGQHFEWKVLRGVQKRKITTGELLTNGVSLDLDEITELDDERWPSP